MKVIVFDPVGGASGDMILGSLVHLGCPLEYVKEALVSLGTGPFDIRYSFKKINGILCADLGFEVAECSGHRSYGDIRALIFTSPLEENIKMRALKIFHSLALVESYIHGVNVDEVIFHEVGALDSIFDIVGISAALEWFDVGALYTTPVPLGTGMIESDHGTIPLPAPATLKLLEGFPVRFVDQEGELVTPTGAAVIGALAKASLHYFDVVLKGIGYGCGDREFTRWPNFFRSLLCETPGVPVQVFVIETDIDDMIPEEWEMALEEIFKAGALDASLETRIMKGGRPATGLRVIAESGKLQSIITALFTHTTTIGVRYYPVMRSILSRNEIVVGTPYGDVRVKEVSLPDGTRRHKAEYRDIQKISREQGIPVARLRKIVEEAVRVQSEKIKGEEE